MISSIPSAASGETNPHTSPLLPLPCPPGSKPVLVLDMDETLIHARDQPHLPSAHSGDSHFVVRFPNPQSPVNAFRKHVYVRPFAHDFLEEMSRHYRVVVFTAGIRPYAEQVIQELDPDNNRITATLFRDSCHDLDQHGWRPAEKFSKDLGLVCEDMRRVLLVDNSPFSLLLQPMNGLLIKTWTVDELDSELPRLEHFLKSVKDTPDLRAVRDRWEPRC